MSDYIPSDLYLTAQTIHLGHSGMTGNILIGSTGMIGSTQVLGNLSLSGDVHIGGNIISNGKHIDLGLFHQQFVTLLSQLGFTGTTGPDFIIPK